MQGQRGIAQWRYLLRGAFLVEKADYQAFLYTPSNRLHFIAPNPAKLMDLPSSQVKVMVWGQKYPAIQQQAEALDLPVLKMEDGFIRSVGLGSNLVPPLSLVIDDLGIYFDAQAPSRLEAIFQTASFSAETLQQADELIAALVAANVGKYNVGQGGFSVPLENKRKIILVPGQVEDDASIKLGSPAIKKIWICSKQPELRSLMLISFSNPIPMW